MAKASTYFIRHSETEFEATALTEGAWNTSEQHVAPLFGLIAHLFEVHHSSRASLRLASLSCDILGVIPVGRFEVDLTVLRHGRTIELLEATVGCGSRAAVRARAWMLQSSDTSGLAGTAFRAMPDPEATPAYDFGGTWDGACVKTIEVRRNLIESGRARSWVRTDVPLLEGVEASPQATFIGMLDFANGISPRVPPREAAFPNIDLNASFFRTPTGTRLGLDTTVSFGEDGVGVTQSILHDVSGPIGTLSQTLTVRP